MSLTPPLLPPIYLPGQEPMPPGTTTEERDNLQMTMKYSRMMQSAMESCPVKVVMAGGAGECLVSRYCVLDGSYEA